jgi:two-component system, OmpR family, phosphate regulon sensor histidine kinase PhoR
MSFRKKILISYLVLFATSILLLFPFIEKTVRKIVRDSLEKSTVALLQQICDATNEEDLVEKLRNQRFFVFFRVSLLNSKNQLLYDDYLLKHLGPEYKMLYPTSHPEVIAALKEGMGYQEGYSQIFAQKFSYVAVAFEFQGERYVLRTAFPFIQVEELIRNFEKGFLLFSFALLLMFSGLSWFIFYRFSKPIQEIIKAIRPYQKAEKDMIPDIVLPKAFMAGDDDFSRLAKTLNSLSERIRSQIKSITEERNEKEAILESLGEGVVAVDSDMHVRYVNFTGSKMLGVPKRHLIGKIFPMPEEKESLIAKARVLLEACQARQTILTDSLSLSKGKKLYLDLIAAPKMEGRGAIIVFQDKSSHYKVLEMGKDFVANASHELRTPITIIKGFAETLQDLPEISQEMLLDILEKIVRNCQRMDTLVKNLLTLADIENLPETRFKECDILSMLDNCRHLLLSIYPETRVDIDKSEERITLHADADLLELAIMNLFDNAAKYSKQPAHISVYVEKRGTEIRLSIQDRGMGIPAVDLEHIFERFYTVNKAHSRRLGGAGLGLSIVKTIVEKHDGTISVTSAVGEGTTFIVTLPIKR